MNRVERLEKALARAMTFIGYAKSGHRSAEICAEEIDAILAHPPAYEDVEVVRWSSGSCQDIFMTEDEASDPRNCVGQVVKLTGTYKRPLPAPVEKMAHGIAADGSVVLAAGDQPPNGTPCVVMWEEGGGVAPQNSDSVRVVVTWNEQYGFVFPIAIDTYGMNWSSLVGKTGLLTFK